MATKKDEIREKLDGLIEAFKNGKTVPAGEFLTIRDTLMVNKRDAILQEMVKNGASPLQVSQEIPARDELLDKKTWNELVTNFRALTAYYERVGCKIDSKCLEYARKISGSALKKMTMKSQKESTRLYLEDAVRSLRFARNYYIDWFKEAIFTDVISRTIGVDNGLLDIQAEVDTIQQWQSLADEIASFSITLR